MVGSPSCLLLLLVLALYAIHIPAHALELVTNDGSYKDVTYETAKNQMYDISAAHPRTLYCNCSFEDRVPDWDSCGLFSETDILPDENSRFARTEAEHVVPASTLCGETEAWMTGNVAECVDRDIEAGRECAEEVAPCSFAYVDIHNLWASVGGVNAARSNYAFVDAVEDKCRGQETFGDCVFDTGRVSSVPQGALTECDNSGAETVMIPPSSTKGVVGRTSLYMYEAYRPRGLPVALTAEELETFRSWHCDNPPSEMECDRNEQVFAYQGNYNHVTKHACSVLAANRDASSSQSDLVVDQYCTGDYVIQTEWPNIDNNNTDDESASGASITQYDHCVANTEVGAVPDGAHAIPFFSQCLCPNIRISQYYESGNSKHIELFNMHKADKNVNGGYVNIQYGAADLTGVRIGVFRNSDRQAFTGSMTSTELEGYLYSIADMDTLLSEQTLITSKSTSATPPYLLPLSQSKGATERYRLVSVPYLFNGDDSIVLYHADTTGREKGTAANSDTDDIQYHICDLISLVNDGEEANEAESISYYRGAFTGRSSYYYDGFAYDDGDRSWQKVALSQVDSPIQYSEKDPSALGVNTPGTYEEDTVDIDDDTDDDTGGGGGGGQDDGGDYTEAEHDDDQGIGWYTGWNEFVDFLEETNGVAMFFLLLALFVGAVLLIVCVRVCCRWSWKKKRKVMERRAVAMQGVHGHTHDFHDFRQGGAFVDSSAHRGDLADMEMGELR